jgi:hypothetical protein
MKQRHASSVASAIGGIAIMADYLLLMHGDSEVSGQPESWQPYLDRLSVLGALRGGSAIGMGLCMRRAGDAARLTEHLVGYIKVDARDLPHAQELVAGNPVYEAGGTVEIRELPRTD